MFRFCWILVLLLPVSLLGQRHSIDLSEAEEEQVRDAAAFPLLRIATFQEIIETRIKRMQDVLANTRAQGRREDLKQNIDEIAGLVDEMQQNLEEYDEAHRDLRKQLPKLQGAMERWVSVLKQPPEDDSYSFTRKMALEAVADVQAETKEMVPAQAAYFKAHPPDKNANPGGVGEIVHPR